MLYELYLEGVCTWKRVLLRVLVDYEFDLTRISIVENDGLPLAILNLNCPFLTGCLAVDVPFRPFIR